MTNSGATGPHLAYRVELRLDGHGLLRVGIDVLAVVRMESICHFSMASVTTTPAYLAT